ncbi:MAG: cysteine--tRNA ligase [Campylobacter sp.]|nr:cysteine--tRNA ligase [Campylobacter sp.]
MVIYDTASKKKVEFIPLNEDEIKIYVCGPTVYDDAHLGHAKSAISFDLLRRALEAQGKNVKFARNFTDIDDKILKKMSESGKTLSEITEFYTKRYLDDMSALNVRDADISPKATENINEICALVSNLLNLGYAYEISGDGIYFDTTKDSDYLSLSGKKAEDQNSEFARVVSNEQKKNEKDFALWKFDKAWFEAPFGRGRPGWHSECVAMILAHLDSRDAEFCIDIHAGGADLLFPHHENEAAQCRCSEHRALAKYWMHNGFVQVNNEKMSKSLGNSFFVKDALALVPGEALRFYLMSSHYRANFNYTIDDLLASKKRLDKIYRLKKRVNMAQNLPCVEAKFRGKILEFLNDDLNTSGALACVDEMVSCANEALDKNPKDKAFKAQILANLEFVKNTLGVLYMDEVSYFQFGVSDDERAEILRLIEQRSEAKKQKNFALADEIRAKLTAMKIEIMDTPNGTIWEKSAW